MVFTRDESLSWGFRDPPIGSVCPDRTRGGVRRRRGSVSPRPPIPRSVPGTVSLPHGRICRPSSPSLLRAYGWSHVSIRVNSAPIRSFPQPCFCVRVTTPRVRPLVHTDDPRGPRAKSTRPIFGTLTSRVSCLSLILSVRSRSTRTTRRVGRTFVRRAVSSFFTKAVQQADFVGHGTPNIPLVF